MKHSPVGTTQIYLTIAGTGEYMIEVSLDKYEDIFNEWDPAPFRRRDVHPDLTEFFEQCSSEINLVHEIAVVFYIPEQVFNEEKQAHCVKGLNNFFSYKIHNLQKQIYRSFKLAFQNFVIGCIFLAVASFAESLVSGGVLGNVFVQGLFIGGWVFVWEALSMIAFRGSGIRIKIKEWERFLRARIIFKKGEMPTHDAD